MLLTLTVLHLVTALLAAAHLLRAYRRPSAAVAWLFALALLPFLGAIAYLMLAVPSGRRSLRLRRQADKLRGSRREQEDTGALLGSGDRAHDAAFARLMRAAQAFPMTRGNHACVLDDDREALEEQLAAIAAAEHEVFLSTYVLKSGRVAEALLDALADRVAAGVDVRLLIDPIGSHELDARTFARLRDRGVAVTTFLKPNVLKGRLQINFRNHRKILCVDGGLAYTGGRNWADEYYPHIDGPDAMRDLTVRLRGPLVTHMRRVFLEDWALALGDEAISAEPGPAPPTDAGEQLARVQPFGPDEPKNRVADVLAGAFRAATDSIFVATPYFVPGPTLQNALRIAALGGVRVELLLPRRSGKRSIDLTSRFYLDELIDAGVDVYLREPPLMHAKAVIVDDRWTTFGSVNFDARSLHLNYELNVEVLGPAFAAQLREFFAADLARATKIDAREFLGRGRWQRTKEKAAALFEPMM